MSGIIVKSSPDGYELSIESVVVIGDQRLIAGHVTKEGQVITNLLVFAIPVDVPVVRLTQSWTSPWMLLEVNMTKSSILAWGPATLRASVETVGVINMDTLFPD